MLDSFGRGLRMIWASIKMGLQDQRLLLPSILTVFTNFFFGILLFFFGEENYGGQIAKLVSGNAGASGAAGVPGIASMAGAAGIAGMPGMAGMAGASGMASGMATGMARNIAHAPQQMMHNHAGNIMNHANNMMNLSNVNGPFDMSGFQALGGEFGEALFSQNSLIVLLLVSAWWLTNRFLEGVTTALTYSHLTEGPGSGRFSLACRAVFESLPAILILGVVTFLARNIAKWLRHKRGTGVLGMGVNFLASIVEMFWTLAGHLILPSIVIEGTSFVGAMKRADRIASGNLLTIGVGEVGVDGICRFVSWLVYIAGASAAGGIVYLAMYHHITIAPALIGVGAVLWGLVAIVVTSFSIYIRAAFYTCLYVWAIEAESVAATERVHVRAPAPLAHALA
jgi:hypothetical protein